MDRDRQRGIQWHTVNLQTLQYFKNNISCKSVDLPDILQCDHSSGTSLPVLLVINNKVLFFFSVFYGDFKKICAFAILSTSDFRKCLELKELAFQALCPSALWGPGRWGREFQNNDCGIPKRIFDFIDIDAADGGIVVFTTHVFTVLSSDLVSMANLLLTYLAKYCQLEEYTLQWNLSELKASRAWVAK